MNCRHCGNELIHRFIDLGFAPPSNAYLMKEALNQPEKYFPLQVKVCGKCWLVQTEDYAGADELFKDDYAYFSSTSSSWLQHAADYSEKMIGLLGLDENSHVIEVASNDGYLLKNFVQKNIPCLGIEPTAGTAVVAEKLGIPVMRSFFGETLGQRLAGELKQADLIAGNNVYAHVPDINDFTRGLKAALKPGGTITLEFPHVMNLIKYNQFDTIYHEHYSYLSLFTVKHIFEQSGLRVWNVDEIPTHGGSLRIYGCHQSDTRTIKDSVTKLLDIEKQFGLQSLHLYQTFQEKSNNIKNNLISFLIKQRRAGKSVAAYGAAAKGNTLFNYAGVKPDLVPFVCDAAPSKQGKYLPGSHIPILPPSVLEAQIPDFLLILPWNISSEICRQLRYLKPKGTRFVTAVPELEIL